MGDEEMRQTLGKCAASIGQRSLSSANTSFGLDTPTIIRAAKECVEEFRQCADSDFSVEPLLGGMTNLLWKVALKNAAANSKAKQIKSEGQTSARGTLPVALVREYGRGTETFLNRKQEERVVRALSDMDLCPRVFGTYHWGRVEEYLPDARPLSTEEYASYEYLGDVANILGRFHARSSDLLKLCTIEGSSSRLKERLEHWYKLAREVKFEKDERKSRKLTALDLDKSIRTEIDWLLNEIEKVNSPVVFAHCDLQEGNLLMYDETMKMIDFEYSERLERGFDLGNCFCEMSINYGINGYPGFIVNPDMFPDLKKQLCFVRAYAKGAQLDQSLNTAKQLLKEANLFVMGSHLHWVIWSIIQAGSSTIDFGYMEYAEQRMDQYYYHRRNWAKLLESFENLRDE